jgi:glycosyltransferase involved in cell wall biosynthesis
VSDKIRLLHCIETISSGGVDKLRLTLAEGLDKEAYDLKIICTKAHGVLAEGLIMEGVEIYEVGAFKHPFHWSKHGRVLQIIGAYQPHIIHGAVFEGNTMACIGGIRGRVPVVILEETSDPKNRSKKANWLLNLFTRFSDRIIAISPSVATYLERTAHVKTQKIQLINNGVETPRAVTEDEVIALKRKYNIQPTDLVIGSVGRLRNFHKLFTDIIEAVALLEDFSSIKILIVGEGQDRALIVEKAKRLGLEEHLIMAGLQTDTAPYYQLMDIFCIASHMEGFGLVAAEAMFHQLPVVATSVGGLKDIVIDGETGFLVPSHRPDKIAEKLKVLIDDPELRRSIGAKGLARAQQEYSAEVYVEKVHQLYQELLMEKGIK